MHKIKNIMVAIAFADYSKGIFSYAADLANQTGANLLVASIINSRDVDAVTKIESMGYEVGGNHYVDDIKKERSDLLDAFVSDTGFPRDRIKTIFTVGNPVAALLKITVENDVDLVVMGVKGRTDLEHIFVGSVAEKMFRKCPVTIVSYRDEKTAQRLRKRIQQT
ncbi:MAG: universal stress protein [Desulfobacteraceae bacterium]|nr:universal stress protein [Desulfobacteraceae bacterium]